MLLDSQRLSEEAYQKVKSARDICKASKTKEEAKSKLEQEGLWWEWVKELKAYRELE